MDKLSGLVLDVGDDYGGEVLAGIFPTIDSVPSIIKEAEHLTYERRAALPDGLFALVLKDGDVTLRKFACADAGNTALSVEYFLKTAGVLPAEAQKVAAQNLVEACGWYGIEPPERLQKIAFTAGGAGKAVGQVAGTVGGLAGRAMGIDQAVRGAQEGFRTADVESDVVNPRNLGRYRLITSG